MENEVYYMNPFTGSVDTIDGWDCDLDSLIEVVQDENGDWVEQDKYHLAQNKTTHKGNYNG